jgi:hypothetical protein
VVVVLCVVVVLLVVVLVVIQFLALVEVLAVVFEWYSICFLLLFTSVANLAQLFHSALSPSLLSFSGLILQHLVAPVVFAG